MESELFESVARGDLPRIRSLIHEFKGALPPKPHHHTPAVCSTIESSSLHSLPATTSFASGKPSSKNVHSLFRADDLFNEEGDTLLHTAVCKLHASH